MKFGEAVEHLKAGGVALREGWHGVDQFIFLVEGATVEGQVFAPYIASNDALGTVSPWLPTAIDVLAEDWSIANADL